jgi:hypothetical protein
MVSDKQCVDTPADCLCRSVYVCAHKSVTIEGIGAGEYRLYFSTGTHWDRRARRFTQSQTVQKFVEVIKFTQTHGPGNVTYSANEISLHPVVGGSARTASTSQEEFDRLQ